MEAEGVSRVRTCMRGGGADRYDQDVQLLLSANRLISISFLLFNKVSRFML